MRADEAGSGWLEHPSKSMLYFDKEFVFVYLANNARISLPRPKVNRWWNFSDSFIKSVDTGKRSEKIHKAFKFFRIPKVTVPYIGGLDSMTLGVVIPQIPLKTPIVVAPFPFSFSIIYENEFPYSSCEM